MAEIKWLFCNLLIVLLLLVPELTYSNALSDRSLDFIEENRQYLCSAATKSNVPSALLAGVIVAETELNRSLADRLQDTMLLGFLRFKDAQWWEQWNLTGKDLANKSAKYRAHSNKWPIELWRTGYVQTFGSAQISPRTAIIACNKLKLQYEECRLGIKGIVTQITKDPDSFIIAGIVLNYEKMEYQKKTKQELNNIGVWATTYNLGSDYMIPLSSNVPRIRENSFGKFVHQNFSIIKRLLHCGK